MHLLYLDDSGTVRDSSQNYFVLGGVSIFERQGYWLSEGLDKIAARFDPVDPQNIELHGSPMRSGKGFWRNFPAMEREKAIIDGLSVFTSSPPQNRLFAVAVNKASIFPRDPVEFAFEQLCSRFDLYLKRLYHKDKDAQRGMILLDKTHQEETLQSLARTFRTVGNQWKVLANLAEVPVFLDSKASRLIQLADLVAYATFRHFEHADSKYFSIIEKRFDSEGGKTHGLLHKS